MQEPITEVLESYTGTIARLLKDVIALQAKVAELNADTNRLLGDGLKALELAEARRKKLVKFFKAAQTARNEMLLPTDMVMDKKTHTRRQKALLGVSNRLCSAMNDLDNDETVD